MDKNLNIKKKCRLICFILFNKINKINNYEDYKSCKYICEFYYKNKNEKFLKKKIK